MDHNVTTTAKLTRELFKLPEPFETLGIVRLHSWAMCIVPYMGYAYKYVT
jgi:hypothetical protein